MTKKIKGDERCQLGDSLSVLPCRRDFLTNFPGFNQVRMRRKIKDTLTKEVLLKDHIIYEDTHVLIYSKPKGILSQPNGKNVNVVDQYDQYAKAQGIVYDQLLDRYGVCNRLDRNTSGLLIIGKNALALRRMNESIKNHQVDKRYRALVLGRLNKSIELKGYQKKDKNNQVTNDKWIKLMIIYIRSFIQSIITLMKIIPLLMLNFIQVKLIRFAIIYQAFIIR